MLCLVVLSTPSMSRKRMGRGFMCVWDGAIFVGCFDAFVGVGVAVERARYHGLDAG